MLCFFNAIFRTTLNKLCRDIKYSVASLSLKLDHIIALQINIYIHTYIYIYKYFANTNASNYH